MKLPLSIFTLALDAARFLPRQLAIFENLNRPYHWFIISGVADNVNDTNWCAKIQPRLSIDGTDAWLNAHLDHPNITILRRQLWPGKNSMVNAALSRIIEPCAIHQIDSDEFWLPEQLDKICELYETGNYDRMRFFCRYFVGPKLVVEADNLFSNKRGEWSRSWLWRKGMASSRHEPPVMQGCGSRELPREETRSLGLVFDHEAYCYEEQLLFKEKYYKYPGALEDWKRLQKHTQFPTALKPFMHWVEDGVTVDKLK